MFMSPLSGELWTTMACMTVARRMPLLSKNNIAGHLQFAKDHIDKPEGYWRNVLWMDETKIKIWFKWEALCLEKITLHSSIRTLAHLWNMVVVGSWFGPVLLHLSQDGLPSLMEQWILNYTSKFSLCRTDQQLQETFSCSYCCKSGYWNQILKAKIHILLPLTDV